MIYRRPWGTPVWHWSPYCSRWPRPLESEERPTKPGKGEFCSECEACERDRKAAASG